jgi:hypothetical protein
MDPDPAFAASPSSQSSLSRPSGLQSGVGRGLETLDEFAERTGVPREEDSPDAIEWVLQRLSVTQIRVLERLPNDDCASAAELNAHHITLNSLWDFRRGERDCLAPLMLVTREFYEGDRCYFWELTKFGKRVKAALAAGSRRAKTPKAVECEASQSGDAASSATPKPSQSEGA